KNQTRTFAGRRTGARHRSLLSAYSGTRTHPVRRSLPRILHDLCDVAVSRGQTRGNRRRRSARRKKLDRAQQEGGPKRFQRRAIASYLRAIGGLISAAIEHTHLLFSDGLVEGQR